MASMKAKTNSRKRTSAIPRATPAHNVWGSQEKEDRGRARYAEYCNDLGAAVFAIGDLETAIASAMRAIKTVEIALLPIVTGELYVWSRFPGDVDGRLKEAEKVLRPHAQQVQGIMAAPEQLSVAIHEVVMEIQEGSEGIWEGTALNGL